MPTRTTTRKLLSLILSGLLLLFLNPPLAISDGPFKSSHDKVPADWTGEVFKLRQDYPSTKPSVGPMPWKGYDFKTQSILYLQSVLAYCLDGNVAHDFQLEQNTVRNWYHAPWLDYGSNEREFIHGLTGERSSQSGELAPTQTGSITNFAVGMYNAPGGYVIGQVWKDPTSPNPAKASFPDGTVSCKLLFTTATVAQVPLLQNSFEWQANVTTSAQTQRTPQTVRLLQLDVAVRDSRANSTTGWVFGTFIYNGNMIGATPWDRLMPVGLMWGNDPTVTEATKTSTTNLTQTFINPAILPVVQHLGRAGRLNGPVDNPKSSCLSCHSTAEWPAALSMVPAASNPNVMNWFRNVKTTTPFDAEHHSLGYSLQLAAGIQKFYTAHPVSSASDDDNN